MKKRILVVIIAAVAACIGMFAALNHFETTPSGIAGKTVQKISPIWGSAARLESMRISRCRC